MNFWHLFWIFFIVIKCSSSDESESEVSETFSSDDESTVGSDTELTGAIDDLDINEKASEYQRQNHLKQQTTSANGARPLSCIDGNGREVDWWFLYKRQDSTQYLYYSSLDVQYDRTGFLPLNKDFIINDINSSPVLKTIYHLNNLAESSEVWLGWNDQPENDEDDNADQRDAYGGKVNGVKHAHSKGFYAQNAICDDPKNPKKVTIGSYLMMTSLPRFPRVFSTGNKLYGDALRNALPRNPANIFDSNLNSKAQHFFCMSLPRETVDLEKKQNVYEVPVNFSAPHVKFLHKYLKTIHPAIMGTNFSDHKPEHWLWRRYFSLLKYPSQQAFSFLQRANTNEQAMAFSNVNLPSLLNSKVPEHLQHVFPLTWSNFYINAKGKIENDLNKRYYRWDAQFSNQNGCIKGTETECLASFFTETTSLQSRIPLNFFAKHGLVHMDLYDDWAALYVAESQKKLENHYAGSVVDRYGLLVQSWIDSRTELPRKPDKKIFDQKGKLIATVHIDNVSHCDLPIKSGGTIRAHSNHRDHSKWAVAFAIETLNTNDESLNDSENTFVPSVFIADLNRTNTQARLKNGNQGRGGGAVVTESINLWRALMKLSPRAGKQDRFANSSKSRSRQLQNRLRNHLGSRFYFSSLPVDRLRPAFFKSLRLSKKEAKKPSSKSVDFVPFLNELSKFIKISENRPEHVAFFALQNLFKSFSRGQIEGQAEKTWKRVMKRHKNEEDAEFSCLLEWPEILTLPSLHLHRQIPREHEFDDEELMRMELENQAPYIIKDTKGEVKRGDSTDAFIARMGKIPRNKETQTETVKTATVATSTTSSGDTDDEKLFDLIESLNQSHLSQSNRTDSDEENDYYPQYQYHVDEYEYDNRRNRNGYGSDSDYSNREIDYDDYDDGSFNEDEYDPYEALYEQPDNYYGSENDSRSSSESEHETDYSGHVNRLYDSEYNSE